MSTSSVELQSILRLLDDENPRVREAVISRLASYGNQLRAELQRAVPDLDPEQLGLALSLGDQARSKWLLESWEKWLSQPSGWKKLEDGHRLLATYLSPGSEDEGEGISERISQLAMDHELEVGEPDFRSLAASLFGSGRFTGATERYYHPDSSNLGAVLQTQEGNPMSLACLYILVGERLGLDVGGCNYPTHFLARARDFEDGRLYLVDCFNGGKVLDSQDLIDHHPLSSTGVADAVRRPATAEVILSRVLRNLENAFERQGNVKEQKLMSQVWKRMARFGNHDEL